MEKKKIISICPESRFQWREWLQKHHHTENSVWLVYYKKQSGRPTVTRSEAVGEALCFGWIDSQSKPIDENQFMQFFSKRKANGTWSKVNKEKIVRLSENGLMTQAGLDTIEAAKKNGSWTILDDVEELIIPADLAKEFEEQPKAAAYFLNLCKSDKRNILQWLVLARRAETRQRRIEEMISLALEGLKPAQFR